MFQHINLSSEIFQKHFLMDYEFLFNKKLVCVHNIHHSVAKVLKVMKMMLCLKYNSFACMYYNSRVEFFKRNI